MKPLLLVASIALTVSALCANDQAAATNDADTIRRIITNDWPASARAGDIARYLTFITDDALLLPPNQAPLRGKAEIGDFLRSAVAVATFDITVHPPEEIVVAGEWAYARYRVQMIVRPKSGGATPSFDRKYLDIWRRDAGGAWKCHRHMWNDNPPATEQAEVLSGRYAGTLPCADCSGIRTVLEVYRQTPQGPPTTFKLTETYLATRDGDRTFTSSGRWRTQVGSADNPKATVYQIDFDKPDAARNFLERGENELLLLDRTQRLIQSKLPYVLTRVADAAKNPVVVTPDDATHPIQLATGQWLTVRLPSNPTTGFRWSLADAPAGLALRGDSTYVADASRPSVGGGGNEIWQFEAVRSGEQKLRFEYRRPWEKNVKAAREASFVVNVR